jgi:perosamine synthetase
MVAPFFISAHYKGMISLCEPFVGGNEWKYVKEALDSGWVSSGGPFVDRFESALSQIVGAPHAIATVNGTSALHVSLLALGVKANEEVLVPTITFIAPVNAVHYCGATPVFFDCDEFLNINLDAVEEFLESECSSHIEGTWNKRSGRRIWGIIPVHVAGNPLHLSRITNIAQRFNLRVVEDASEALGSSWGGTHVGTCGDIGCFSFNGNKIVTTGGGGMIVTNDASLAKKIRYLTTQAKNDTVRFVHDEVGFNYRLTAIQAAVGVAQLEQLPAFLSKKREHFLFYQDELHGVSGVEVCKTPSQGLSNHWLTNISVTGISALELIRELERADIQTRPLWFPNHLQKPYQGCQSFQISQAERIVAHTVSLPCSVGLKESDREKVVREIKRLVR